MRQLFYLPIFFLITNAKSEEICDGNGCTNATSTDETQACTIFTAENLEAFYKSITAPGYDSDNAIRFEPFNKMDQTLQIAPYAVSLLATLSLIGTELDFDLSGFEMNYTHMLAPGSFRASVSQLGDEGFESFRIAQKEMLGIQLLTSQFKGLLNDILRIVFSEYSDQLIQNSLGSTLNMTLSIVKRSNDSITNIISGFDKVHDLLSEIGYATYLKQGDTENARKQLEAEKKEEEERKKEYAERIRQKEEDIQAKNIQVEQLKQAYKSRVEEFEAAKKANSKIKNAKPVKIELTIAKTHNGRYGCGGDPLKVELSQGSTSCETGKTGGFSGLDTLEWSSNHANIGACSSTQFNLDQTFIDFKLKSSNDNYCPKTLTITFAHGVTYSKDIYGYYDDDNNNDNHSADRRGTPTFDGWKVEETKYFPSFTVEVPESNQPNIKVKNTYGKAVDNTFSAMDTYFGKLGEQDIINITTIQQYDDNNDPKSVNNVIDFLNQANVTISIQINDLGADQNYGNRTKSMLADLVQMCNDVQSKVTNGQKNSSEIYNMYNQKKVEMNLLKDMENLKKFDDHKTRSTTELRNALSVLERLVRSDFENAFESKNIINHTLALNKNETSPKIIALRKSITDCHYKHENQNLADDMIVIIQWLEKFIETETNETTIKKMIDNFQNVQGEIKKITDAIANIRRSELGTLLSPPTPIHKYSADMQKEEKKFTAEGTNAAAIVEAAFETELAKKKLDNTLKQLSIIHEKKESETRKIKQAIIDLATLAQQTKTLEGVITVVKKAMKVFADLKEQWKILLLFFDQMSKNIEIAMGDPIQKLCTRAGEVVKYELDAKITEGRRLMYDAVFQSSTMSYIIQKQAGLYCQISEQYIMPAVMRLDVLLSYDSITDKQKIKEEYNNIKDIVKNAHENIHANATQARDDFKEKVETRILNLESFWNGLVEKFPVVANPTIKDKTKKKLDRIERYGQKTKQDDVHTNEIPQTPTLYPPPQI